MWLHSALTGGDVPGVSEDRPARCFRSQVWIAPEQLMTGTADKSASVKGVTVQQYVAKYNVK